MVAWDDTLRWTTERDFDAEITQDDSPPQADVFLFSEYHDAEGNSGTLDEVLS